MKFTDDDLKRLKDKTSGPIDIIGLWYSDLEALLLRLEKAERCVRLGIDEQYGSKTWFDAQDDWRKSCGRFNQSGVNNNRWKAWRKACGRDK